MSVTYVESDILSCYISLSCVCTSRGGQVVFRAVWNFVAAGADKTDAAASRCTEASASHLGRIPVALRCHTRLGIPCTNPWPWRWGWTWVTEAGGLWTVFQFSLSVSWLWLPSKLSAFRVWLLKLWLLLLNLTVHLSVISTLDYETDTNHHKN